jgi:hypothetical protein
MKHWLKVVIDNSLPVAELQEGGEIAPDFVASVAIESIEVTIP